MWIVKGTFARSIGKVSAAESVGTGSNGTTEPRGHGGRRIDTVGAKLFLSGDTAETGIEQTPRPTEIPRDNRCSSRAPLTAKCHERKVRIIIE